MIALEWFQVNTKTWNPSLIGCLATSRCQPFVVRKVRKQHTRRKTAIPMRRALVLWVKSWSLSGFASLRWWGCEGTCGLRGVEEDRWFYYAGMAGQQSSDHVDIFCKRESLKGCKLSFPAFDNFILYIWNKKEPRFFTACLGCYQTLVSSWLGTVSAVLRNDT